MVVYFSHDQITTWWADEVVQQTIMLTHQFRGYQLLDQSIWWFRYAKNRQKICLLETQISYVLGTRSDSIQKSGMLQRRRGLCESSSIDQTNHVSIGNNSWKFPLKPHPGKFRRFNICWENILNLKNSLHCNRLSKKSESQLQLWPNKLPWDPAPG